MRSSANPFGATKASDLTDAEIFDLWVDAQITEKESLRGLVHSTAPMPTLILGGKGSGKTHLMRYLSYPVQKLRYVADNRSTLEGLQRDKYIGIYIRCSGLSSSRFQGKGQTEEAWAEIFSYFFELWLGQALLRIATELIARGSEEERQVCSDACALFDAERPAVTTLPALLEEVEKLQRKLDFAVNNAAFTRQLNPSICLTRGSFVFGLPKAINRHCKDLSDLLFAYELDEFENLSSSQQKHVNTLVREREAPATFKIGARQFGIRTYATFSGEGEVNVKDSEFEELRLDQRFRDDEITYRKLARSLILRRLEMSSVEISESISDDILSKQFAEFDTEWRSPLFAELFAERASEKRPHFQRAQQQLQQAIEAGAAVGVPDQKSGQQLLRRLHAHDFPLLEKLNLLLLYGRWAKGHDLGVAAKEIAAECQAFIAGEGPHSYRTKLGHFKSHLVAQLLRARDRSPIYDGVDTFVRMSEGQPRALITLLKETFDWAVFQGENPFSDAPISSDAQSRGALKASEWFYSSMTGAGDDGRSITQAIDRIAELFRINHYADNPKECSLIGFSMRETNEINSRAKRILALAQDFSFIVDRTGGQRDRNSERVDRKLQLNRMLCPRWGLPTGRRGIAVFGAREINAIFDPEASAAFSSLTSEWSLKMSAPFFGARSASKNTNDQSDLFNGGTDEP